MWNCCLGELHISSKTGFKMGQQCRNVAILLLIFQLLILGSGQQDFEDGLQRENEDFVVLEFDRNETNLDVEEETIGREELEDHHLQVGKSLLVEGGLQVTLLRAGRRCRRKVVRGDLVAIQYEGRLEGEEGSLFHTTRPTQPFVFVVQDGRALPGIVAGVRGMCRGEIRSLYLPMDLAWGEKPPQPLPANASVHYKVELEMIQEGDLLPLPAPPFIPAVEEACYVRGEYLDCQGLP